MAATLRTGARLAATKMAQMVPLGQMKIIKNNLTEFFQKCPLPQLRKWFHSAEQRGRQSSR